MIRRGEPSISQIAEAGCSRSTILRIPSNIPVFSSVKAPPNKGSRPQGITPVILEALYDHLREKPNMYLNEMTFFPWDKFDI